MTDNRTDAIDVKTRLSDTVKVTKNSLAFGPTKMYRVNGIPSSSFGRIGDIAIVDNTAVASVDLASGETPTLVGVYHKDSTGVWRSLTTPITFGRQIYVSATGSDSTGDGTATNPFASIKQALSIIDDNSSINRYTIRVAPGVFTEQNPIVVGEYITVGGMSTTSDAVVVQADDVDADLFVLDGVGSSIADMTVTGATNASLVRKNDPTNVRINNVTLGSGQYGIRATQGSILVNNSYATGNFTDVFLGDGGTIAIRGFRVESTAVGTNVLHLTDPGSLSSVIAFTS